MLTNNSGQGVIEAFSTLLYKGCNAPKGIRYTAHSLNLGGVFINGGKIGHLVYSWKLIPG